MISPSQDLADHLVAIYGQDVAVALLPRLNARLDAFVQAHPQLSAASLPRDGALTQADVILITYGDQVRETGNRPLATLHDFLRRWTGDLISGVHILPFYPYSSDDGFSVIDYHQVDPELGDWRDVERLGVQFRLMFDAVINHISRRSQWFRAFCAGQPPYRDFFIVIEDEPDLSQVVRPRALPLLTPVETHQGVVSVWTTFSADQIDLNFASPDLLLAIVDVLLDYVAHGAQLIRLDAVGFIWKELGTSCIHLPQAHRLVQLFRTVLDWVAPATLIVTETNVPHAENISYFGDGQNEAQMVYNFTLPPLTLHAFLTGDARHLSQWAATLETPSPRTTFFNFLASHDGIGLRPLEGILTDEEIQALADRIQAHGGLVGYRHRADGSQVPYELNIVYYDALNDAQSDEPQARQVDRFMASQAILLSLAGVPGIYVQSLFGGRNWTAGATATGHNRTINRRKYMRIELEAALLDPAALAHQVYARYAALLRVRRRTPAFHPNGAQQVLDLDPALFVVLRSATTGDRRILCAHNVSAQPAGLSVALDAHGCTPHSEVMDLLSGERFGLDSACVLTLALQPYQVRWLRLR